LFHDFKIGDGVVNVAAGAPAACDGRIEVSEFVIP
jgi:hypothetical protein